MANKGLATVGKVTCGVLALGAAFVIGTSIAGAVNERSFVDEINSWGKQEEQQIQEDETEQTPEDENQTEGEEAQVASVNLDLENNLILLRK